MKKIVLSGLCVLFSVFVFAQTWEELNKQVNELSVKGEHEKVIPIAQKAIEAAKKEFGEEHLNYIASIYNLGTTYASLARYKNAEPLLIQAKEILKQTAGENTVEYWLMLNNLGVLYERTGQYEKAEPLHLQGIQIIKKIEGDSSARYAQSLNNLSLLYVNIGQYEKGEYLNKQGLEIQKKIIGENNPAYINGLNNLAFLYKTTGLYQKAEPLYLKVKELRKKLVGENHADYANILNNLGTLYTNMGEFEKAESLLKEASDIRRRVLGENNPNFTNTLNNLALLYEHMLQPEKAEVLYKQTMEIRKKILGETHPAYVQVLNNLAICYIRNNLAHEAEPLALTATGIQLQNLKQVFGILSEREKKNYLINNIQQSDINNSLLYKNLQPSSQLLKTNFDLQLFLKSLSLSETLDVISVVSRSKDSAVLRLLNNWQNNKKLLARQYALPQNRRMVGIDTLETKTELEEKELSRKSSEFRRQQNAVHISMKNVQDQLEKDEAAIEFVSFGVPVKTSADSTVYAAYVLTKNDSVPRFVPLFEEKQLQRLLDSTGKTTTTTAGFFYRGLNKEDKNTKRGEALYRLVWQPLEPCLAGVKKISYSPAGKLFSIAFHALPLGSDSLLMEKYQMQQYTSTRQVALRNKENQNVKPASIALFGDATFSMDSSQLTNHRPNLSGSYASRSVYTPSLRGGGFEPWGSLPGTAEEVNSIKQLFDKNKITTTLFTQTASSEENLKALSGSSPQVLHIATHGFFLPDPNKAKKIDNTNVYTIADDPLLRTGLVLSGGNYAWSGKTPIDGVEDGIVTAYEIAQLNLSNTELVVLSACETALGDVKGTEGVFGLQRAFKMAGVKKMIVSLWKVPDRETSELMTAFYTYWMKGKTINDAFAQAQADMRKKYSPFYWAAFVLVE